MAPSKRPLDDEPFSLSLHFPEEATAPVHKRHLELRTLLYLVLGTLGGEHTIGSNQFVYWDPTDPSRWLAPDAFVRLGVPDSVFGSWKTWERGVPEVAVEIVSDSDASSASWEAKLRRYQELGVRELVRFDWEETAERQLRIWDRVEGELVPRTDAKDRHLCRGLSLYWVVVPTLRHPATLRLARDAEGRDLVGRDPWLTPEETKARVREAEARIREAEARGREAAEQRVAELEAQLRLQKG
ncbi:MAG TPA: Uma2 family endonuclease [Polyangiaceae bacterium]|nr:Uma2 family endonuclease [Polyangiaceae bacterium]